MLTKELEQRLKEDPIFRKYYYMIPPDTPRPKPKAHILVEGKIAEAAKANPAGVWVHVRDTDGILHAARGVVEVKS
jgi:hypothetical protein